MAAAAGAHQCTPGTGSLGHVARAGLLARWVRGMGVHQGDSSTLALHRLTCWTRHPWEGPWEWGQWSHKMAGAGPPDACRRTDPLPSGERSQATQEDQGRYLRTLRKALNPCQLSCPAQRRAHAEGVLEKAEGESCLLWHTRAWRFLESPSDRIRLPAGKGSTQRASFGIRWTCRKIPLHVPPTV